MDVIAIPLDEAKKRLQAADIPFSIEFTHPYTRSLAVNDTLWYVLRQRQQDDGSVSLLAAAKMGKEVFINGL